MTEFSRLEFIKSQKPVEPLRDWRVWILLGPIAVSVIGMVISGLFSFSFDSIAIISKDVQNWLVVIGSVLMVLGAEANTPGTFIEVFRKIFKGETVTVWDYLAITLSAVGTLATLLIANAIRIMVSENFNLDAAWVAFVITWMPLVAALAVGFDYYGALAESGSLFASYEKRMEVWLTRIEQEQSQPDLSTVDKFQSDISEFQNAVSELQSEIQYLQSPTATLTDWRKMLQSLNGSKESYAKMAALDAVREICKKHGFRFDSSERTAYAWHKELSNG